MKTLLAAIDNNAAAQPVVQTATVLAGVLKAHVQALHVREDGSSTARAVAEAAGVPLMIETGSPDDVIVEMLKEPDMSLAVLGARAVAAGAEPAGHIALSVVERASKPVVVVPPDATVCAPGELKRLLVPLNGTEESASAVRPAVSLFSEAGIEIITLHVFDENTVPAMLDHAPYGLELWTAEFLARHCPPSRKLHLRSGEPGADVVDVSLSQGADMIALAWSQELSPGRAYVVRRVLTLSCVPVLLYPMKSVIELERREPVAIQGRSAGNPGGAHASEGDVRGR